ncbi:MAG: hypothetical protein ACKOTZ_02480, partial [Chloroflexota bacterium]
ALLACRTLVQGDRDGVSCDIDPEQPDCPRREYVAPRVADFIHLMRLGVLLVVREKLGVGTASKGWVIAEFLVLEKAAYTDIFGDASCAEGGGNRLEAVYVGADDLPGVGTQRLMNARTASAISSLGIRRADGPTTCVDFVPQQIVIR